MNNQSAEDYLDKLLNSVSSESTEEVKPVEESIAEPVVEKIEKEPVMDVFEAFAAEEKPKKKEAMYSRRVTKSEADFLREFEAELEGDDFDDFLKGFDDFTIEPEEKLDVNDIPVQEKPVLEEEFSLGGVDLGALLNEATEEVAAPAMQETVSAVEEPAFAEEESMPFMDEKPIPFADEESDSFMDDEMPIPFTEELFTPMEETPQSMDAPQDGTSAEDMFANLFGEDAVAGDGMDNSLGGSSEGIDLSNLGEADLMSLLTGEDGLSDIGSMLSNDGVADMGEVDAFAMFAEGEMAAQTIEEEPEEEGKSKKKKKKKEKKKKEKKEKGEDKGGLLGKLSNIFTALMSDDDEEDEIELKKSSAPSAEQLSDENAEILAAFQDIDDRPEQQGKEKKKKEKKKKEKKEKPKKEKKEKKPKKPKEPKPKKEKKPKVVDNTPPLPRGPVLVIWLMAISLFALVILGVNLSGYSSAVSTAKEYHDSGEYANAYAELLGYEIKEKDTLLYNQVATLAAVDSELNAFDAFLLAERHEEALDSLVCAAGRCQVNADNAEMYECQGQMQILQAEVTNKLYANYGMTYEEAVEIYESRDRDDYSIALIEKLRSLGLVE